MAIMSPNCEARSKKLRMIIWIIAQRKERPQQLQIKLPGVIQNQPAFWQRVKKQFSWLEKQEGGHEAP